MGFDDLNQRMGKRNGVSRALISDPVALARRHEGIAHLLMLFGCIAIIVVVSVITMRLGTNQPRTSAMSGVIIFACGFAIVHSVKGLLKLHHTRRAELAPARSLPPR